MADIRYHRPDQCEAETSSEENFQINRTHAWKLEFCVLQVRIRALAGMTSLDRKPGQMAHIRRA